MSHGFSPFSASEAWQGEQHLEQAAELLALEPRRRPDRAPAAPLPTDARDAAGRGVGVCTGGGESGRGPLSHTKAPRQASPEECFWEIPVGTQRCWLHGSSAACPGVKPSGGEGA